MEDIFQIIPVIIFAVIALVGAMRRQNRQRSEPDVVFEEEDEVFLPPWGSLEPVEEEIRSVPPVESEEPPYTPPETPSSHEISPDDSEMPPSGTGDSNDEQLPQVDTIAGIALSSHTVRQGIILSEILGRPKSLRRPRE